MKRFCLSDCGATSGKGPYTQRHHKKVYSIWFNMLERCYDEKFQSRHKSYIGCRVCNEWLNFQNFAAWYVEQNKPIDWHIDKDILISGNKLYSPDTCCLVPAEINKMFVCQKSTKHDLPRGVFYKPRYNKSGIFTHYRIFASCKNAEGKQVHIGYFDTIEEAAAAYKEFKLHIIQMAAERYKSVLSPNVYNALIDYKL